MAETRLRENRRTRQTEKGNSRGAAHSIKRARVRLSARDCTIINEDSNSEAFEQ